MASFLKPSRPLEPHPPLNPAPSPPQEVTASEDLLRFLDQEAPLADEANTAHREEVLNELTRLFRSWVRTVCVAKSIYPDEEAAAEAGGTIFVSGSFKLGVNSPDGDIDAICIAPRHVTREDFFGSLPPLLKQHPGCTEILPIPEAKVPIIELMFEGVNIDLLFATIPHNSVPPQLNILDDSILQGVDEASMITLNGPRVTHLLHLAVPNPETFKVVLRALRHWAKVRGLYSNKMGFLGGVNFGILAAFMCQLFPNMAPAGTLHRFFQLFQTWKWPSPVYLTKPYTLPLGYPVWDPEHDMRARRDVMPIITPAYPASNSSYNVSKSTLAVMMSEIARGAVVTTGLMSAPVQQTPAGADDAFSSNDLVDADGQQQERYDWARLFEPSDFFTRFDSYLVLDISADSEQDLLAWKGFVESRVRKLVEALEYERLPLSMIYPFPKAYAREDVVAAAGAAASATATALPATAPPAIGDAPSSGATGATSAPLALTDASNGTGAAAQAPVHLPMGSPLASPSTSGSGDNSTITSAAASATNASSSSSSAVAVGFSTPQPAAKAVTRTSGAGNGSIAASSSSRPSLSARTSNYAFTDDDAMPGGMDDEAAVGAVARASAPREGDAVASASSSADGSSSNSAEASAAADASGGVLQEDVSLATTTEDGVGAAISAPAAAAASALEPSSADSGAPRPPPPAVAASTGLSASLADASLLSASQGSSSNGGDMAMGPVIDVTDGTTSGGAISRSAATFSSPSLKSERRVDQEDEVLPSPKRQRLEDGSAAPAGTTIDLTSSGSGATSAPGPAVVPGIVTIQPSAADTAAAVLAEGHQQHEIATPAEAQLTSTMVRTTYSYYIGIIPDKERMKGTTLNLTPVLKTFKLTSLLNWPGWKPGMSVRQRVVAWAQLPEEVLPGGRAAATEQRKAAKAAAAAAGKAATATAAGAAGAVGGASAGMTLGMPMMSALQQAAQSRNVWVKPGGGGAAGGSSSSSMTSAVTAPLAAMLGSLPVASASTTATGVPSGGSAGSVGGGALPGLTSSSALSSSLGNGPGMIPGLLPGLGPMPGMRGPQSSAGGSGGGGMFSIPGLGALPDLGSGGGGGGVGPAPSATPAQLANTMALTMHALPPAMQAQMHSAMQTLFGAQAAQNLQRAAAQIQHQQQQHAQQQGQQQQQQMMQMHQQLPGLSTPAHGPGPRPAAAAGAGFAGRPGAAFTGAAAVNPRPLDMGAINGAPATGITPLVSAMGVSGLQPQTSSSSSAAAASLAASNNNNSNSSNANGNGSVTQSRKRPMEESDANATPLPRSAAAVARAIEAGEDSNDGLNAGVGGPAAKKSRSPLTEGEEVASGQMTVESTSASSGSSSGGASAVHAQGGPVSTSSSSAASFAGVASAAPVSSWASRVGQAAPPPPPHFQQQQQQQQPSLQARGFPPMPRPGAPRPPLAGHHHVPTRGGMLPPPAAGAARGMAPQPQQQGGAKKMKVSLLQPPR